MRAVIQRVKRTSLSVDGELISEIPSGLAVYLGVAVGDEEKNAEAMAKKIAQLRIFEDAAGKMNLSVREAGGEVLLICSRGNRPSFTAAARPEQAKPLYEYVAKLLSDYGLVVRTGVFGADMKIEHYNDGPVTIIYEC